MIGGFSPFVGTTQGYQGANQFYGGADTRRALANSATGNETPAELVALGATDKAAALQQAKGSFNYQYATAWEAAEEQRRKKANQQPRLYVFG